MRKEDDTREWAQTGVATPAAPPPSTPSPVPDRGEDEFSQTSPKSDDAAEDDNDDTD